jgi:hypothetical protein
VQVRILLVSWEKPERKTRTRDLSFTRIQRFQRTLTGPADSNIA